MKTKITIELSELETLDVINALATASFDASEKGFDCIASYLWDLRSKISGYYDKA